MDIKEMMQLILAAGSTIDTLWNTFIGVHFALIAAIYFLNREFMITEKILLSVAYFVFGWLNYWALVSSYQIYGALITDAKLLEADSYSKFKTTHDLLMTFDYTSRTGLVTSVHILAGLLVFSVIYLKVGVIRSSNPNFSNA